MFLDFAEAFSTAVESLRGVALNRAKAKGIACHAEEAYQDAIVYAWENRDSIPNPADAEFRVWFVNQVGTRARMRLRYERAAVRDVRVSTALDETLGVATPGGGRPDEEASARELRERIVVKFGEVGELALQGLNRKEVAQRTGRGINQVGKTFKAIGELVG